MLTLEWSNEESLLEISIPPKITRFIQNLVSWREISGQEENIEINTIAFRGLPQGSVLSPSLYNIYVHKIEKACTNNCKLLQYADDICVYVNSDDVKKGIKKLEKTIKNIFSFLQLSGLTLSGEKSQFCIFSQNNKITKL